MVASIKPVTAARAAQLAANSKAYRVRVAAAKFGVDVPTQFALKRPAMYRPPAVVPGASPAAVKRSQRAASAKSAQAAAVRASGRASAARAARAEAVGRLPQARNPEAKIFTARPVTRKVADGAKAESIRERAKAEKVRAVGKRLKADFRSGEFGGGVAAKLDPEELARFNKALARMGKVSDQALGVFNNYEGGSGDLESIISSIHYPAGDSSKDEALTRLEAMAEGVERAESLYGSKAVGKIDL